MSEETYKPNSWLLPGVTVFPELERPRSLELNKSCEKALQKILALNDREFQRLKTTMARQEFKVFMNSVLKKKKPAVSFFSELEEKKPISSKPRTLREKMQRKGWVIS